MTAKPLVSVIIPTYNSAPFIESCVDSIRRNAYPNVEIVIVDDGSPDNTLEIIKGLATEVTLVEQANAGRGSARNNGVNHASGDYIAFLDHDDLLEETSIEDRVHYLAAHPEKGWVFTDAMEYNSKRDLGLYLDQFPWLDLKQDQFIQLLRGIYPLTSTIMVRSSLLKKIGGFNTSINYGDDIELFMRLLLVSEVGMIKKPLSRRLIHPGQGVSSTFDRWDSRVGIYSSFRPSAGEMSPAQQKALGRELKHSRFKLGECHWEAYNMSKARASFLKSLGFNAWSVRAFVYAGLTLLPTSFLKLLRRAKAS
jgi:glycosyltransferase involved in cell wall biosynthesis